MLWLLWLYYIRYVLYTMTSRCHVLVHDSRCCKFKSQYKLRQFFRIFSFLFYIIFMFRNGDVYSWRWQVINGDSVYIYICVCACVYVCLVLSRWDYVWPEGRWYNDERKGQRVKIIIKSRTELTSVFIICPGFRKGLTGPSCAPGNRPHARAHCNIGNENVLRVSVTYGRTRCGGVVTSITYRGCRDVQRPNLSAYILRTHSEFKCLWKISKCFPNLIYD